MLKMLSAFASLSLCGTVVLSVLPEGGIKRTAGMAIGLLTLMCWAEGVQELFRLHLPISGPATALSPSAYSVSHAAANASSTLAAQWEADP